MASRGRKSAVDRAFEEKLKGALSEKDWAQVVELFDHYGHYLELVEPAAKEKVDAVQAES